MMATAMGGFVCPVLGAGWLACDDHVRPAREPIERLGGRLDEQRIADIEPAADDPLVDEFTVMTKTEYGRAELLTERLWIEAFADES
jgi:hypothetical protein